MAMGLMVPGRASTPSDGRAQHYTRPGDTLKQETRTFVNGTTLTFGPEDRVENFVPNEAFYEQVLVIFNCVADIKAVRDRYPDTALDAIESEGIWDGAVQGLTYSGTLTLGGGMSSIRASSIPDFQDVCQEKLAVGRSASLPVPLHLSTLNNLLQVGDHTYGGSTVNVYQSNNRSNSPGLAHPGYSTDTRGPRPAHVALKVPTRASHGRSSKARLRGRRGRSGHSQAQIFQSQRQQDVKRIDRLPVAERMSMYVANRAIAETTIIVPQGDHPGQTFAFRINPPSPTNVGNIVDLYSSRDNEYWQSLVSRNINPDYRGLSLNIRNSQAQEPVPRVDAFERGFVPQHIGHQYMERDRTFSLNEINERRSPDLEGARYVGYNVPGESLQQLNRPPTPILPFGTTRATSNKYFHAAVPFPDIRASAESRSSSPGGVTLGTKKSIRNFSEGRFGIALPTRPSSAGYQFP